MATRGEAARERERWKEERRERVIPSTILTYHDGNAYRSFTYCVEFRDTLWMTVLHGRVRVYVCVCTRIRGDIGRKFALSRRGTGERAKRQKEKHRERERWQEKEAKAPAAARDRISRRPTCLFRLKTFIPSVRAHLCSSRHTRATTSSARVSATFR